VNWILALVLLLCLPTPGWADTQTHATDCTLLTCDTARSGQTCYEIDADTFYICDSDGPAWTPITGGHADGANCAAGEIALGVDASGAVQGCYEPTLADITDANPLGVDLSSSGRTITTDHTNDELIFSSSDSGESIYFDFSSTNELQFRSTSGVTEVDFGTWDIVTSGEVNHKRNTTIENDGARTINATAIHMGGHFFVTRYVSGTTTYTVSAGSAGDWFCITDLDASFGIIVDPDGSDQIFVPGIGYLAAGNKAVTTTSPALGDSSCFTFISSSQIIMYATSGTWTDGGA